MTDDVDPSVKKSRWNSRTDLMKMPREDLVDKILKQVLHIEYLMTKQGETMDELVRVKEASEKQKTQIQEGSQRECILVLRLTAKEQEVQDFMTQVVEMKQWHHPASAQIQSRFLDPAVNVIIERLKSELDDRQTKINQLQDDLLAVKFTPDSQTGKRLMAKCRGLHAENEEFGRMTSSGRVFKLEGDVALEQQLTRQLRITERDTEACLAEFDEESEAMLATIYAQQSALRQSQDEINLLKAENARLLATSQGSSGGRNRNSMGDSSDTRKLGGANDRGYNTSYGGDQGRNSGGMSGGSGNKRRDDDWRGGGGGRGEKFGRYDVGGRGWDDRGGASSRGGNRSSRTNRGTDRSGRSSRDSPDRGRDSSYRRNRSPDRQNRSPDHNHKRRRRDSTPDIKRASSYGDRESRDRTDIRNHDIRRKSKDTRMSEENLRKRTGSPLEGGTLRDAGLPNQHTDELRTSDSRNGGKDSVKNETDERETKRNSDERTTKVNEDRTLVRKVDKPRAGELNSNLSDNGTVPANGVQGTLNGLSSLTGERFEADASLKTGVR